MSIRAIAPHSVVKYFIEDDSAMVVAFPVVVDGELTYVDHAYMWWSQTDNFSTDAVQNHVLVVVE